MLKKTILTAAVLATTATALPAAAEARPRYRDYGYSNSYDGYGYRDGDRYDRRYRQRSYDSRYYDGYSYNDRRRYRRCSDGTTGAIVGGAAGALLGREIARSGNRGRYYYRNRGGDGTTGAILGGAIGALIGNEVGRNC